MPEVGVALTTALGGRFGWLDGTTKSVTLGDGTVSPKLVPPNAMSACRRMATVEFTLASCQTCAVPAEAKCARLTVMDVWLERNLLTTMTVSAPSEVLCAAKADTLSGFGPPAATLISPKVDLLPS